MLRQASKGRNEQRNGTRMTFYSFVTGKSVEQFPVLASIANMIHVALHVPFLRKHKRIIKTAMLNKGIVSSSSSFLSQSPNINNSLSFKNEAKIFL